MTTTRIDCVQVTGRDGLKGQTFSVRSKGCTIFAGPMGSGKSTRLEAIIAGIRGIADTASDTTRVYLGPAKPRAVVTVALNVGGVIKTIRRDAEKGPKTKEAKAADAEANVLCGAHVTRFDLRDFAEGTDAVRRTVLDGVCRAAGVSGAWDRETTTAWLDKALEDDETGALQRLFDAKPLDTGVGDWLPGAIEWAREQFTASNRDAKTAEGHATTALGGSDDAPGGTFEAAEARLAAADKALAVARAAVAAAEAAGKQVEQRKAEAVRRVQAVERATAERDAAEAEVKAAAGAAAADVEALMWRHIEAKTASAEKRTTAAAQRAALETTTTAAAEASRRLSGVEGERAAVLRLSEQCSDRGCVHCGGADPLDLAAELQRLDAELVDLVAAADDASTELTVATSRSRRADQAAKDAAAAEGEARQTMHDAEEAQRKRKTQTDAARARLDRAKAALVAAEADLAAASESTGAAEATSEADAAALQAAVEAAGLERAEAAAERDLHLRHQEREVARQKAVAERERLDAVHAGIKALGLALKELQGEVARAAYGPVVDAANGFLRACSIDIEVYINGEADFGAVLSPGWKPDSRPGPVVFWSLSGGERALVGAAFAVAFARLSGAAWCGLILDELNHIDAVHLPKLIAGLAWMVSEGELSDFFGAYNAIAPPVFDGAEVVWLGPSVEAA